MEVRPTIRLLLALWLVFALVVAVAGLDTPQQTAGAQASPQPMGAFSLGVNYPWLRYGGDFGSNQWATGSVSTDAAAYDVEFADMAAKGVRVVRWFVFADGRSILADASGTPTGVAGNVVQDVKAAVGIAARHGIKLDLVLFDYLLLKKASLGGAGHADWINDPTKRTALLDTVVIPLLTNIGHHPNVLMWEVMNEPEWAIADLPGAALSGEVDPTTQAAFWDFASRVSAAVHSRTGSQVTMGSASLWWARVWTDAYAAANGLPALNLDIYQTHYYPSPEDDRYNPFRRSYADVASDFGLDRPLIVGEFTLTSADQLDTLLANGYAGGWPWSYRGGEPVSTVNWDVFTAWEQAHRSDLGDRPPTPPITPSPTATAKPPCVATPIEATGTALTLMSAAGVCWSDAGGSGSADLTYGHVGCSGIDGDGFCTGGAWPGAGVTIDGARWIWKSQQADQAELGQTVTFTEAFTLPADATAISGTVRITADNAYRLFLNGIPVGADEALEGWRTIDEYELAPRPGPNTLLVEAMNLGTAASPNDNPAGLLYRLDVSFASAPTATATTSPTDTPVPTVTATPTSTPTITPTSTPTVTPTLTPTHTATSLPTPTNTQVQRPTRTPTPTKTPVPTRTPVPQPPAAPTNLAASQSRTDVLLTWRDNATTELGYRVYRSADNGRTWSLIADALPANTVAFTDGQVPRGTTYRYAVAAYNAAGESKRSNVVKVAVP